MVPNWTSNAAIEMVCNLTLYFRGKETNHTMANCIQCSTREPRYNVDDNTFSVATSSGFQPFYTYRLSAILEDREECFGLLRPKRGKQYVPLSSMVLAYYVVISNEILNDENYPQPSRSPAHLPFVK